MGNLSLGGTGKTPMVQWLARWFRERGVRVAVISRGYGAKHGGGANDEALELERKLPGVDHLENPDRVAAVQQAVATFGARLIVLDDAFQHRRMARNLDIVLLDALEPFGFEHVFPRGTLREPISGLARAHVVALSRAELLDSAARREIRQRVKSLAPEAALAGSFPRGRRAGKRFRRAATRKSPGRAAGGGILRPGQSRRLPLHARGLRIPNRGFPRVSRPPLLWTGRHRIAGRLGR